ncbi:MAG: 50S ribosomal protein L16 [Candidatus Diapherotrites archaeon]|nr:50S ribosomal protein L16 [Candidatus Diapherotrites archaeon]
MGIRPARCYRSLDERPYTRVAVTVHKKNYIGTIPQVKIRQFNMGNPVKEFSHILDAKAVRATQVRDNAIESSRISINRYLNRVLGKDNYFMRIRQYPHHILRENKMAQGAGADRVSDGMSHPFGRPVGRAVRVLKNDTIMSILVDEKDIALTSKALMRANKKMSCGVHVKVGTDTKSIGTRPKEITDVAIETTVKAGAETVTKEGETAAPATADGKEASGKTTAPAGGKAPTGKEAAPAKKDAGKKK